MKKVYFSALIFFFCGLFATAQTNDQNSAAIISDGGEQGPAATFNANSESTNSIVMIRWKTSDEKNIDHFVVEHSTDGIHFEPLHSVVARGGSSLEAQSYQDGDAYPAAQANYYRLAIVSKEGNAFYSPDIEVDMTGKKMPALAPTVLQMGGTLRVEPYYRDPVTINFFNGNGTKVGTYMVNSSSFNISTSGWGKGIFFYRISDATHPLIDAGKIMVL